MFALLFCKKQRGSKRDKETRKAFFPNLTNYINQSLLLTAWYDWLSKEVFARRGFYGANLYYAFISHINIFYKMSSLHWKYMRVKVSLFQIQFDPSFYMRIVDVSVFKKRIIKFVGTVCFELRVPTKKKQMHWTTSSHLLFGQKKN